jgi:hypothetical protein
MIRYSQKNVAGNFSMLKAARRQVRAMAQHFARVGKKLAPGAAERHQLPPLLRKLFDEMARPGTMRDQAIPWRRRITTGSSRILRLRTRVGPRTERKKHAPSLIDDVHALFNTMRN